MTISRVPSFNLKLVNDCLLNEQDQTFL